MSTGIATPLSLPTGPPSSGPALAALAQLVGMTSASTGQAFFEALVVNLTRALGVKHAMVGEFREDGPTSQVHLRAVAWNRVLAPVFTYGLPGTPCEVVHARGEGCYYPDHVAELFPLDVGLARRGIQSYMGVPLRGPAGELLGLLVVMDDAPLDETREPASLLAIFADRAAAECHRLAQQRRLDDARARLQHAEKMEALGRLAGSVVHDFNNLLMALGGFCSLAATARTPEVRAEALEDLQSTVDRGTGLVKQLLAFARPQAASMEVFVLAAAVRETMPLLRRLVGDGVALQLVVDAPEGRVRMDPVQLQQILTNLVVNAKDAGPSTITVRIAGREIDARRELVLSVGDDGAGMSEQTRARAFEPFFTTKAAGRGTGLGLATVHGIVRQAEGAVWIDSAVGRGTTVLIALPAA